MSLVRTSIWHHLFLQHDGCYDFASFKRGISSIDEASVELGCLFCFLVYTTMNLLYILSLVAGALVGGEDYLKRVLLTCLYA